MNIDRHKWQGDIPEAKHRLRHCLNQLEVGFKKNIDWDMLIAPLLTLEEIIGALVISEQAINHVITKKGDTIEI